MEEVDNDDEDLGGRVVPLDQPDPDTVHKFGDQFRVDSNNAEEHDAGRVQLEQQEEQPEQQQKRRRHHSQVKTKWVADLISKLFFFQNSAHIWAAAVLGRPLGRRPRPSRLLGEPPERGPRRTPRS